MIETTALHSLSKKCRSLNQLKQIHAHLLQTHLIRSRFAIGTVLSAAETAYNGSFFFYACSVFDRLLYRTTYTYNNMIKGYVLNRSPAAAVMCYMDMLRRGIAANNYSFPPLIKASTILAPKSEMIGRLVHAHVVMFGSAEDPFVVSSLIEFFSTILDMKVARKLFDGMPRKDVVLWTTMVDGYGKVDDVENARKLFDRMAERNSISWSAMMAAYCRVSDFEEVLHLFRQVQEAGTAPNESMLVTVLTACAQLGALVQGLWVHTYVVLHGFDTNQKVATSLVNMFSKCGYLEPALSVFGGMTTKDAGAWNAIISAAAMSGDARKSVQLFHEMSASGTQPNETTFVAVLSACTHARLVKEGLKLFEQMSPVYRVEPRLQHYGCVIDLLARAGMLEEAEKLVEERIGGFGRGDVNVWGALLSACRIYGNFEMGIRIWKKLADLKVADSGMHKLSYNMYKEVGMEAEAKRVQRMFKGKRMYKTPGCSSVDAEYFA